MKSFKEFYSEEMISEEERMIALLYMMENSDTLNESEESLDEALKQIKSIASKAGFKIHKSKGILDYIKTFVGGTGKVMMAMLKGDTEKAKEIVMQMNKSDVLDFLYKLDLGTLHLFTGPIHMIDAWTGWDLAVEMGTRIQSSKDKIAKLKDAVISVKNQIEQNFESKIKKSLLDSVHKIMTRLSLAPS